MRFESIRAQAFGPFRDEKLEFAPRMTFVYGPNESGKSSWHAALYAALCGMRRARGTPRKEDREFTDRHRPWDGEDWAVSIRVCLDDSRRIELHQELDGRVDCRATDLALGTDIATEIINEGSPDGARWLDLDRRSFQFTACVRQAETLAVIEKDKAKALQADLQRAAATGGSDATAREAIERLKEFQKRAVGQEQYAPHNISQALRSHRNAHEGLDRAQARHERFVELATEVERLEKEAEELETNKRVLEAAEAVRIAREAGSRLDRAEELAAAHPEAPESLDDLDSAIGRVERVLGRWDDQPEAPDLSGRTVEALEEELAGLPSDAPAGDEAPDDEVLAALDAYEEARRTVRLHEEQEPPEPRPIEIDATASELRALADDLAAEQPQVDPALERRLRLARQRAEAHEDQGFLWPAVAGAGGLAAGILAVVLGFEAIGVILALAGIGAAAAIVIRAQGARTTALQELRDVEHAYNAQAGTGSGVQERREAAEARADALGAPADPSALRELAERSLRLESAQRELAEWRRRHESYLAEEQEGAERLERSLQDRDHPMGEDLLAAAKEYVDACHERSQIASQLARRQSFESELAARRSALRIAEQRGDAQGDLERVAETLGIAKGSPEEIAERLREWLDQERARRPEVKQANREWDELQGLLGEQTLEELRDDAEQKRSRAEGRSRGLPEAEVDRAAGRADLEGRLDRARERAAAAQGEAKEARGHLEAERSDLPSVPEAEERLALAEEEIERLRRLDETLNRTIAFLEEAEEQVHRNIAPRLAQSVERWLPDVTGDRYRDVIVNPETLEVTVRDTRGGQRVAALLSKGTAEPIYLLLRVALAEHLTGPGEKCPIVLDDVSVQCDRQRTQALMSCLHQVANERQVIVFTQEQEALSWAERSIQPPDDALIHLEPVT